MSRRWIDRDRAADLYEAGWNVPLVAAAMGHTDSGIRKALQATFVDPLDDGRRNNGGRNRTPDDKIARLREAVEAGMTVKAAAHQVGVGYRAALRHVKELP